MVNSITGADPNSQQHILKFNDYEVLDILTASMNLIDLRLQRNLLEAITSLLKLDQIFGWGGTENSVAFMMEQRKVLDALDELQKHPN